MMDTFTEQQVNHMKGVIESLLFVNEKSVTLDQMVKVLETVEKKEIKKIIYLLMDEYKNMQRGMNIVEIAGGFQMLSNPQYASYIKSFYKTKHKEKLTKPSLETVAIIAYKQPVTRGDIELIRGVNSDGVVANLLKKELIKIVGRRDVAGKPYLYGTTRLFLEYFGLKSLNHLPKLQEEFPSQDKADNGVKETPTSDASKKLAEHKTQKELSASSEEVSEEGKVRT